MTLEEKAIDRMTDAVVSTSAANQRALADAQTLAKKREQEEQVLLERFLR